MLGDNVISLSEQHLLNEIEKLLQAASPAEAMLLLDRKSALVGRRTMKFAVAPVHFERPIEPFRPSVEVQRLVQRIAHFLPH